MAQNATTYPKKRPSISHGQYITALAMLIALGIVLKTVTIYLSPTLKISFTFIPQAITAALLGPEATIIQSGLTDVLGIILFPTDGGFIFQFTISAIVSGIITGFILSRKVTLRRIVIARVLVNVIVYIFLNSFWMEQVYNLPFKARVITQLIKCPITGACEIILLSILLPAIVNSVKRFGFNDVQLQDNITISNFSDFKHRLGFPLTEALIVLLGIVPLVIPSIELTYSSTQTVSFFDLFGKLFDGNLTVDNWVLAILLIPTLLTTVCFLLSFSKNHSAKVIFGVLNAFSLTAVFKLILEPYFSKIDNLTADYSVVAVIFAVYALISAAYVAMAFIQKKHKKAEN